MRHLQESRITPSSINSQPWESQQVKLYDQIQALEIDQPGASLPFSKRLARDHQWSFIYTQRVIEEYKKFLFLAIVADHPVTPSNAVDQAWHLHLTYTHSYWDDLCAQILPRSLHHHPTQGGLQQRELFWDCHSKTLESYKRFFGYCAPADIWPAPATRFRQAGQFRQVNSQNYWMIPKPNFALARRVLLNISHQSWLRVVVAASLTIGLVFSLDFLCHSAIAADLDWINVVINQPAVAQVSSPPNSYAPLYPEVEPTSYSGGSWWTTAGFFLIFGFICAWIDSWCPICKRFWLVKTTTCVLRERTEQTEGEQLITRSCKCCKYTQERRKTIPRGTDSDFDACM